MLRLLFVCRCQPLNSAAQIEAMQKDVWRRWAQKNIGGFLVRHNRSLIGLLEGPEKTVVGQVEHLIRKHKVEAIQVVDETTIEARRWTRVHTRFETLADIPDGDEFDLLGLAQNALFAVQADHRNN